MTDAPEIKDEARSGPLFGDAGEPAFILSAADPLAEYLVALWAQLNAGEVARAAYSFAEAVRLCDTGQLPEARREEPERAMRLASAMAAWRAGASWCRTCFCTEWSACEGGCGWADAEQTVCTSCVSGEGAHA